MNLRKFCVCAALVLPVTAFGEAKRKSLHDEFTGQGYGTAGCGLGSIVFGEKPGAIQVFASTTNDIGYQTFAISSGTSNCEEHHSSADALRASIHQFVAGNGNQLKNDIAKASGDSVTALETMSGCKAGSLGSNLQRNYSIIFSKDNNQEISQKLYDVITSQAECNV